MRKNLLSAPDHPDGRDSEVRSGSSLKASILVS